jgi:fatty-acyl-CoA synthase
MTELAPAQHTRPALPMHHGYWPATLPRSLDVPETSLWFNLEASARRYPRKPLVVFFGRRFTYAQVQAQSEAIAGWLQHVAKVGKGDRVLLYTQNCPQHIVAWYAIIRAGAVVVPVNPMNRADELRHYITDAGAKTAIIAADLCDNVLAANDSLAGSGRLEHLLVTHYGDALGAEASEVDSEIPGWMTGRHELPAGATHWADALAADRAPLADDACVDDLAVMPYTSGTTGFPKGCMHAHRSVMHNTVGGNRWTGVSAESTVLAVLPLFHVTGMIYGMHGPICAGATIVMLPRWDREAAGRLISRHRITHWTNIPTMVIDLLASPNLANFDLSSLQSINGGGAAMPQAVAERLREQFGLSFVEGYGLSETMAPTHCNPPERARLQCLGVPFFGTDARVVDPDSLQEVPDGETGEIVVSGPQVFLGYWRNEAASAAAFFEQDGKRFFRTGDLGRRDEGGFFYLTDRLKRMINESGFKVWPAEVENMLYRHPAVREACIIGTRDPYRGESVKAVIVLRDEARGITQANDIIEWAKTQMAAYKYPREIEFADELPKSATGKVLWRVLQEREDTLSRPA